MITGFIILHLVGSEVISYPTDSKNKYNYSILMSVGAFCEIKRSLFLLSSVDNLH